MTVFNPGYQVGQASPERASPVLVAGVELCRPPMAMEI